MLADPSHAQYCERVNLVPQSLWTPIRIWHKKKDAAEAATAEEASAQALEPRIGLSRKCVTECHEISSLSRNFTKCG